MSLFTPSELTFLKEEKKHFRILSSEHFYYISIFPSLKSKAFFKAKAMGGVLVRMDKEALKDVKKSLLASVTINQEQPPLFIVVVTSK